MGLDVSAQSALRQPQSLTNLNLPFYYLSLVKENGNSCDLIEIDGRLDHKLLERAICSALSRHPLLSCRIRKQGLGYVWQPLPSDSAIDLRIDWADDLSEDKFLTGNVWEEPLAIESGRMIRFHLTETPKKSYFQIVSTHACADARSCFRLAHDISSHYSILTKGGVPPSEPIETKHPRIHLWKHLPWKRKVTLTFQALLQVVNDLFSSSHALHVQNREEGHTAIEIEDLGADGLRGVKEKAARLGVTAHSLFLLALGRTCSRFNGTEGPITLIDMFSLRTFANEEVSDIYDCMVVPYKICFDTREQNGALLKQIASHLSELKTGDILKELYRQHIYALSAISLPKRFATRLVCRLIAKTNVISTNPGNLRYDLANFGASPVTDYWSFSQLFPPGKVMVMFSTFRDRLRLVAVYDKKTFPDGVAKDLLQPLAAYLNSSENFADALQEAHV